MRRAWSVAGDCPDLPGCLLRRAWLSGWECSHISSATQNASMPRCTFPHPYDLTCSRTSIFSGFATLVSLQLVVAVAMLTREVLLQCCSPPYATVYTCRISIRLVVGISLLRLGTTLYFLAFWFFHVASSAAPLTHASGLPGMQLAGNRNMMQLFSTMWLTGVALFVVVPWIGCSLSGSGANLNPES